MAKLKQLLLLLIPIIVVTHFVDAAPVDLSDPEYLALVQKAVLGPSLPGPQSSGRDTASLEDNIRKLSQQVDVNQHGGQGDGGRHEPQWIPVDVPGRSGKQDDRGSDKNDGKNQPQTGLRVVLAVVDEPQRERFLQEFGHGFGQDGGRSTAQLRGDGADVGSRRRGSKGEDERKAESSGRRRRPSRPEENERPLPGLRIALTGDDPQREQLLRYAEQIYGGSDSQKIQSQVRNRDEAGDSGRRGFQRDRESSGRRRPSWPVENERPLPGLRIALTGEDDPQREQLLRDQAEESGHGGSRRDRYRGETGAYESVDDERASSQRIRNLEYAGAGKAESTRRNRNRGDEVVEESGDDGQSGSRRRGSKGEGDQKVESSGRRRPSRPVENERPLPGLRIALAGEDDPQREQLLRDEAGESGHGGSQRDRYHGDAGIDDSVDSGGKANSQRNRNREYAGTGEEVSSRRNRNRGDRVVEESGDGRRGSSRRNRNREDAGADKFGDARRSSSQRNERQRDYGGDELGDGRQEDTRRRRVQQGGDNERADDSNNRRGSTQRGNKESDIISGLKLVLEGEDQTENERENSRRSRIQLEIQDGRRDDSGRRHGYADTDRGDYTDVERPQRPTAAPVVVERRTPANAKYSDGGRRDDGSSRRNSGRRHGYADTDRHEYIEVERPQRPTEIPVVVDLRTPATSEYGYKEVERGQGRRKGRRRQQEEVDRPTRPPPSEVFVTLRAPSEGESSPLKDLN